MTIAFMCWLTSSTLWVQGIHGFCIMKDLRNQCQIYSWSVIPFPSCLQSFPASGSFPRNQFLPSMGSHRVGHDWSDLAAAAANVDNLISGSSAFSKSRLYIWKFSVHVLLKAILNDFEHYLASMWNECNCVVIWAFFGIAFLWDWAPPLLEEGIL